MIQAVIYRRVSTKRQDEEGKSLEDQDAELVDYCKALKWEIIGNFQDAISGRREKTEKRVGFANAVAMAIEHKATLVVYDVDRLARSQSVGMRVAEELRDKGAKLVIRSLGVDTNTPSGEMILGIMLAVAQWGSRNIGAGVARANRNTKRELGYRTQGRQRYGYTIENKQLVPVAAEQPILTRARSLRRQGDSLRAIAAKLNEAGHLTREGKAWSATAVYRALGLHKNR